MSNQCEERSGSHCGLCFCHLDKGHEGQHENWHGSKWPIPPREEQWPYTTIAALESERDSQAQLIARLAEALVYDCRGCQQGLPRLTPTGLVDYKYHDFGPEPLKWLTDAMGYDLEDYERLARYLVCDLSESQAAVLAAARALTEKQEE